VTNREPVDVLALDAMGVLFRSADDVAEHLIPYAHAKGSTLPAEKIEELYRECSLGRFSTDEFWQLLGATEANDAEYCLRHQLTEGVEPLLRQAHMQGMVLACLSNDVGAWSVLLRRRFDLERYIAIWVISGDIGFRKPAPQAYQALLEAVRGVSPSRVLFVDDRLANVRAARAAGLTTVWFGPEAAVRAEDGEGCPTPANMASFGKVLTSWK
jgi:HAD superfamily hydrolase (TIGR01509 family)